MIYSDHNVNTESRLYDRDAKEKMKENYSNKRI